MPVNMPEQPRQAIVCFVMYFIIEVTAQWEQIESCPRGHDRIERQRNLCGNASLYHCIPDDNCQLHQFCANPQAPPLLDILFIANDSLFVESIKNIPYTNTELYGDLTLYICQYFTEKISNGELFKYILKRIDIEYKDRPLFKLPCKFSEYEYILPTLDTCKIQSKCFQTRKMDRFKLLNFNNGTLSLHEFEIAPSNRRHFYTVGFLLCVIANNSLHEYIFNEESIPTLKDNSSNAHYYGLLVIPVIIIIISAICVRKKLRQRKDTDMECTTEHMLSPS